MDILRSVRDGALGPTQIMYRANLSWIIVTAHLKDLVEHGVLSEHKIRTRLTYVLTERGINILRSYRAVVEQFELAQLDMGAPDQGRPRSSFDMR